MAEVRPFFELARPTNANPLGRWLLWLGSGGLVVSLATGYLGTRNLGTVMSQTDPWREHAFLAYWTTGSFAALSVWRAIRRERPSALLALIWLSALWVLANLILTGRRLGAAFSF